MPNDDNRFTYNDTHDYEVNFKRWFQMNCKEKFDLGEEEYSEMEGKRVFNELHGSKAVDEKLKEGGIKTYDGYQDILNNIKSIIKTEALTEMQKDSLLSKIKNFEIVIEETLSGRADEAERAYREAKSGEA